MVNFGIPEATVPDWYKQNAGAGITGMNQAYDTVFREDARDLGMLLQQMEAEKASQAIRKADTELKYQEPLAIADLISKQGAAEKSRLEGAQSGLMNTPDMLRAFVQNKQNEYTRSGIETEAAKTEDFLRQASIFTASGGDPFKARQAGVSPELLPQLTELNRSGKLGGYLENLKTNLQDSVGQRQKIQVEDVKGKWDLWKQYLHNQGTAAAAGIAGDKAARAGIVQSMAQIGGMINKLEGEVGKYTNNIEEATGVVNMEMAARKQPDFPYRGTQADKKQYIKDFTERYKKISPDGVELARVQKELQGLRQTYKEMHNFITSGKIESIPQSTQSTEPPKEKVLTYNPSTGKVE